jgi:hypothetical protein
MIKSLVSQGPYLVVNGGYHNFPYMSPGAVGAGQLRWNTNTNAMEVNDGISWRSLGAIDTSISLTEDAKTAIDWALKRMKEERELEQRMQRHPGLRDTWEKFKIMESLCREEDARQLNS